MPDRGKTIRRLQRELAAAQDALRPLAKAIDDLEAKDEITDDEAKALETKRAEAAELATKAAELRAELDREIEGRERDRALAPVRFRPGDFATREPDPATTAGFKHVGEFMAAVKAANPQTGGRVDERLMEMAAGEMTTRGDEGFMVPPAFRPGWELLIGDNGFLAELDTEPTASSTIIMDADEDTPWGTGGVRAYWGNEATQMTASELATQSRTITVDKVYALLKASDELLADAPRLEARINRRVPEKLRYKIKNAVIRGTGGGQPLGFLNAGCLVSVAKESGQAADTIVGANIKKMMTRILRTDGVQGRMRWLANPDALEQLESLTIAEEKDRIFTYAPTATAGDVDGYLMGRPLRFDEAASALGDVGDIVLYDPLGYYLPIRQALMSARSMHVWFDYGMEAFRFTQRVGGQPHLSAAVTPPNSANTRSHFVALAAR